MPIVTRHSLLAVTLFVLASSLVLGAFVWSGLYDIGADDTHTRPVHSLLQTLRERSIEVRASELQPPPDLLDAARIRQGAGNYSAMCVGCHLAPGMAQTELSRGLNPAPPDLTTQTVDAAEAFWVIKHGIKASGMPAWGKSMDDEYIWNMAAFLQRLPELGARQYEAMVASSGGHEHGGGETAQPHGHDETAPADHHQAPSTGASTPEAAVETVEHVHADGTVESHPVEPGQETAPPEPDAEPKADDGHQHQH